MSSPHAPSVPGVELVFGNARVRVDASTANRRGGLRAFAREAERNLALVPNSYGFFSATEGRISSYESLQRALESAASSADSSDAGICTLEIRESSEAKQHYQELRLAEIDERVDAKLKSALADIQADLTRAEARTSDGLAPLVQSIATEQIDMRAKMDLLQAMAMEQIDVRSRLESFEEAVLLQKDLHTRLDQMAEDALASRIDLLEGLDELERRFDGMVDEALATRADHLESLEELENRLDSLVQERQGEPAMRLSMEVEREFEREFESERAAGLLSVDSDGPACALDDDTARKDVRNLGVASEAPNQQRLRETKRSTGEARMSKKASTQAKCAATTMSACDMDLGSSSSCSNAREKKLAPEPTSFLAPAWSPTTKQPDMMLAPWESVPFNYSSKVAAPSAFSSKSRHSPLEPAVRSLRGSCSAPYLMPIR